jgi:hypothetical protein
MSSTKVLKAPGGATSAVGDFALPWSSCDSISSFMVFENLNKSVYSLIL